MAAGPYRARRVSPVTQVATRVGLWAAVAIGGVGGVFGLVRSPGENAEPVVQRSAEDTTVPAPVAGVAELVVDEWLTATPADQETLDALFVDPPSVEGRPEGALSVNRVSTIAGRRLEDGYWAVTVATDVVEVVPPERGEDEPRLAPSTWFVEVSIVGDSDRRLVALTTPAVVPPPPAAATRWRASEHRPDEPDEDDGRMTTVTGFLDALLTGTGDPSRYLAPGVEVAAVDPAPFTAVDVTGVAVDDLGAGEIRIMAHVRATTPGGATIDSSYEIIAVERAGTDQWEIGRFSGAPTLVLERPPDEEPERDASPSSTGADPETSTTAESTTADDPLASAPGDG